MRGLTEVLREYQLIGEIPKSTVLALKQQPTLAELPAVFPPLLGQGNPVSLTLLALTNNPAAAGEQPQKPNIFSKILNSINEDVTPAQDTTKVKKSLIRSVILQREKLRLSGTKKRTQK